MACSIASQNLRAGCDCPKSGAIPDDAVAIDPRRARSCTRHRRCCPWPSARCRRPARSRNGLKRRDERLLDRGGRVPVALDLEVLADRDQTRSGANCHCPNQMNSVTPAARGSPAVRRRQKMSPAALDKPEPSQPALPAGIRTGVLAATTTAMAARRAPAFSACPLRSVVVGDAGRGSAPARERFATTKATARR